MPCCSNTLAGLSRDCGSNLGGIKRVLLACWIDPSNITVTNNQITSINKGSSLFYEYEILRNTSSFTSTYNFDPTNNSSYFDFELTLVFPHMTLLKWQEVDAMINSDLSVVFQDRNNNWWYMGLSDYLKVTTSTGETGTAIGDANQYTVTISGEQRDNPYPVDPAIINGLLTPPTP